MKKIIFMISIMLMSMMSTFGAELYTSYDLSFSNERPDSMFLAGGVCTNTACTNVVESQMSFYSGDAQSCMDDVTSNPENANVDTFNACMLENEYVDGIIPMSESNRVIVKLTSPADLGSLLHLSPNGDSYVPQFDRMTNIVCGYDICFNSAVIPINFEKKQTAIAEIQELNIFNTDSMLLPVQVEVEVEMEETVCSAYRASNPNFWRPIWPQGFSDYSALTNIKLLVSNENSGVNYFSETVQISIEADTCAALQTFEWTPSASLENEDINFRVETEVVDNQVIDSIIDYSEVVQTVYPIELDNACWAIGYWFSLANIEYFNELTPSIAQYTQGETIYAGFAGGAFRDNNVTEMDYIVEITIDGVLLARDSFDYLDWYSIDLTEEISTYPTGSYEVELTITPEGVCDISNPIIMRQNLEILAPDMFDVDFYVFNENNEFVEDASVNLELLSADDYFVNTPTYDETEMTDSSGFTMLRNAYRGEYVYIVTKDGYSTTTNNIHIGSDMQLFITISEENTLPVIDLPLEYTVYYESVLEIDLRDYITDFNDVFEDLSITPSIESGEATINLYMNSLYVSTSTPNDVVISIEVEDTAGAIVSDTTTIHFIDNQAPIIQWFDVYPNSGEAPFTTSFYFNVFDADNETLNCTIEFGDGTEVTDVCNNLYGIEHDYNLIGTYGTKLTVYDAYNFDEAFENVFVFQHINNAPLINLFTADPISGINNLTTTFTVLASDSDLDSILCTLNFGDGSAAITGNCDDLDDTEHYYSAIGAYTATLSVTDGVDTTIDAITINVLDSDFAGPSIDYFTLITATGDFTLPNDLTFTYQLDHSLDLPMDASIYINGVVFSSTFGINSGDIMMDGLMNFNTSGPSRFTLEVTDGSIVVSQDITQAFYENGTVDLSLDMVNLNIENEIVPGDVDFSISILNETLALRELNFIPTIKCEGITYELNSYNNYLDSKAISTDFRADDFMYYFEINTQDDFNLLVPTDVSCRFTLNVEDDFGTNIQVSESVMFRYVEEEEKMTSIRGKATDVVEYMNIATKDMSTGYNNLEFRVVNNNDVSKELTISMSSLELGINERAEVNLRSGGEKDIYFSLLVEEDIASGMYPIRISVFDGSDKQVRYSYMVIK